MRLHSRVNLRNIFTFPSHCSVWRAGISINEHLVSSYIARAYMVFLEMFIFWCRDLMSWLKSTYRIIENVYAIINTTLIICLLYLCTYIYDEDQSNVVIFLLLWLLHYKRIHMIFWLQALHNNYIWGHRHFRKIIIFFTAVDKSAAPANRWYCIKNIDDSKCT